MDSVLVPLSNLRLEGEIQINNLEASITKLLSSYLKSCNSEETRIHEEIFFYTLFKLRTLYLVRKFCCSRPSIIIPLLLVSSDTAKKMCNSESKNLQARKALLGGVVNQKQSSFVTLCGTSAMKSSTCL